MPLKMSNSIFTASEGVLESFYRQMRVFHAFVKCSDFEEFYPAEGEEARTKRQESYKHSVRSIKLINIVCALLRIIGTIRRYFRVFYSTSCNICDVYQLALDLEQSLNSLRKDGFITTGSLKEVMDVFRKRKEKKPLITQIQPYKFPRTLNLQRKSATKNSKQKRVMIKLIEDFHIVAYLLEPSKMIDYTPHMNVLQKIALAYVISMDFENPSFFVQKLVQEYQEQSAFFLSPRRKDSDSYILQMYLRILIFRWTSGACKALHNRACGSYTQLSSIVNSCSSYVSVRRRLNSKERSRMKKEKLAK